MRVEEREKLPQETGVYLFWKGDCLLYVGKAKKIRQRVLQHFRPQQKHWISEVTRIEFMLLPNEEEALLSERELIYSKKPRYNIRLRDDRSYPRIAISLDEEFPRVYLTREHSHPGRLYFGPWTDARRAKQLLAALPAIYPFRSCTGQAPGRGQNPCLDYYIDRCQAPCVGKVSKEDYRLGIDQIIRFLRGYRKEAEQSVEARMREAAKNKNFEAAALYRDRLRALRRVSERGREWGEDRNVVHFSGDLLTVLQIREGRIAEKRTLLLESEGNLSEALELLEDIEPELPLVVSGKDPIDEELLRLAEQNGRWAKKQEPESSLPSQRALRDLQSIVGIYPRSIEGYDVANLGEQNTVAGIVFFLEGVKTSAKSFPLVREDRPDDYASIEAALAARSDAWLHHSNLSPFDPACDKHLARRPDLILIDGGPGQLSAALRGGKNLQEAGSVFLSIAKRQEKVFSPSGLVHPSQPSRELLQQIRDAVHQEANSRHRQERSRDMLRSPLDDIPGLGPVRRQALLKRFPGADPIRQASVEEIAQVPGISRELSQKIKEALH
jgi:excinuclease ABC subunit C